MIQEPKSPQGISIKAQSLLQKFSGKTILSGNISFQIPSNSFVGLLGPSGSGKSTLLKACCGLQKPTKGEVDLNQDNLYKNLSKYREKIGYVPQDDIIHQELTVYKAIHYAARLRLPPTLAQKTREALVTKVIHEVGLEDRKKVRIKKLSGGQRKRASVAVELLNRPGILFLDEPTSGQDPQLEEAMMNLFKGISREGTTVIVTTHAMASVELLDLVILLCKGHLVYMGPPADMLDFFESKSYEGVYRVLSKSQPNEWVSKYNKSPFKRYLIGGSR